MTDGAASATFTTGGRPIRVHALQTGTVTIKRCHHGCCLPERSPYLLRFLAILADRRFAAPMPIWTYVVEHPGGLVVVDAGAEPSYNDPASWADDPTRSRRLIQSFIRLDVADHETLPARLVELGRATDEVDAIVLTHQHVDHTASVPSFERADVWTTRAEDAAANMVGALHWRWRDETTRIRHVDVEGVPGELGAEVDLLGDGSIVAIHTPGHTPGSVSARLLTDQGEVWFTGDTAFTADSMDPDAETAGIHTDLKAVRALQARLRGRGLLLPSHDWSVPERLRAAEDGSGSIAQ